MRFNVATTTIFLVGVFGCFICNSQGAPGAKIVVLADVDYPAPAYALFPYHAREETVVAVTNIEELYSAVNDPQNAGSQINIAPGIYMLSANDPLGVARPNGGRIELQQDMSLQGVVGDRSAVVIDANDLPSSSYIAPPLSGTGAIRMGRGSNSIEWLTVKNAVNGAANIETDLPPTGTIHIQVRHVASTNSQRGLDVRNVGSAMAGRMIEVEIVDNDFYNNRLGAQGEGLRLVNNNGANGGIVHATLNGNRSYNNYLGLLVEDNGSDNANISIVSSGDRFFENGDGAVVGGALSIASGNTVSFTATGTTFLDNNGFNNFDHGGLVILGGENTVIPNGTSNNTVNVVLRACRLANNHKLPGHYDLQVVGGRSNPASIGPPGTNNHVKVRLYSTLAEELSVIDSIPDYPEGMNSATVCRPSLDFDNDAMSDISLFRPSNATWYMQQSTAGFAAASWGVATDKITPADYDGDGKTDLAVYRPSEGNWYVLRSSTGTLLALNFGISEDLPVPADFDSDGLADIAVYRPSTGTWWILRTTSGLLSAHFGTSGDKPVVGDYDGDGRADLGVFRPSNGNWYYSSDLVDPAHHFTAVPFGLSTDMVTPADFDGDGKIDVAVYRPSNGIWYWLSSGNGGAFNAARFGVAEDIPVAADYDADGKADISVFRPSSGIWYRLNSSNGAFVAVPFGTTGDRPIPAAFRY